MGRPLAAIFKMGAGNVPLHCSNLAGLDIDRWWPHQSGGRAPSLIWLRHPYSVIASAVRRHSKPSERWLSLPATSDRELVRIFYGGRKDGSMSYLEEMKKRNIPGRWKFEMGNASGETIRSMIKAVKENPMALVIRVESLRTEAGRVAAADKLISLLPGGGHKQHRELRERLRQIPEGVVSGIPEMPRGARDRFERLFPNSLRALGYARKPPPIVHPAGFNLIFMWGMWDDTPYPYHRRMRRASATAGIQARLYQSDDIRELVASYTAEHNTSLQKAYEAAPRPVARADIGRYLLLFYYGGLYLDNDAQITRPLTGAELNHPGGIFFTELYADLAKLGPREAPQSHRIANYALGSAKPKSKVIQEIIDEAVRRTLSVPLPWTDRDVIFCTGPDVVTTVFHRTPGLVAIPRGVIDHSCEGTWRTERKAVNQRRKKP